MNRTTLLGVFGAAALAVAGIALVDEGAEVIAGITVGSPPARPAINQFEVAEVHISAGKLDADVQIRSGATTIHDVMRVTVTAGQCVGLRYTVDGRVEKYTRTDASITVAAAFGAFTGASGGFGPRAAALEIWLQGGGRLCLPQ